MQDLFGDWLLIAQWGRHDFRGQYKQYAFPDESSAQKKLQKILRKRLNSHKRIGCNYVLVEVKQFFAFEVR